MKYQYIYDITDAEEYLKATELLERTFWKYYTNRGITHRLTRYEEKAYLYFKHNYPPGKIRMWWGELN